MKFLKAIALALVCALSSAPSADAAITSFRSSFSVRAPSFRATSIPRVPRMTTPKITAPKATPRITAPYTRPSTTVIHHDYSPTSSPWFWMWMMDRPSQQTVVAAPAGSTVKAVESDDTNYGALIFLGTFIGGIAILLLLVMFSL